VISFGISLMLGVIGIWFDWGSAMAVRGAGREAAAFSWALIASNILQVAVLAVAAQLARWNPMEYFALKAPQWRDLLHGVGALAAMLVALEILTQILGRESVSTFQVDAHRAAREAGTLALLWIAFVIAAPVGEEVIFRGFLFRGWAASPIGPQVTILLSALVFALLHIQYDWWGMLQTFGAGALFGWLRWRSGSTTLTIILHMLVNFVATLWATIKIEWLV
jgi:membrane protease YdiL (CAAX protease family)